MKKAHSFLFSLLLIFSVACKQSSKVSSEPVAAASASMQKTDSIPAKSRLVVAFYSEASGVDDKAIIRFEDSIGEYSGSLGINIDYEKTHWGREGETDFCLELSELNAQQQADFVAKTRELLKTAEHVNIYENEPCRHRRPR